MVAPVRDNLKADPLVKKVAEFVLAERLLGRGDKVLAAVSGGQDSLALLHVLWALQGDLDFDLAVASFDHGLRAEAGRADRDFVEETARRLGLAFHGGSAEPAALAVRGLSLEEAARRARYSFLASVARRWGSGPSGPVRVALGHTADDQAETVLMRVIEGTGLDGLGGMPLVREEPGWVVIRPLLRTGRRETESFCRRWGLEPRLDDTNLDVRFRRNFVRHRVLPVLEQYNPRVREALLRLADVAAQEAEVLAEVTRELAGFVRQGRPPEGECPFDGLVVDERDLVYVGKDDLFRLGEGLRSRLLRQMLVGLVGPEILREVGLEGVKRAARAAVELRVGGRLDLPGGVVLEAGYSHVFLARGVRRGQGRGKVADSPKHHWTLTCPGRTEIPELGWAFSLERSTDPSPAAGGLVQDLAAGSLAFPLRARTRRPGDALRPVGLGGTKKLKDLFIDCKIPRAERDNWPVLVDAQDRVVWVVGLRADERFAARPGESDRLRVTAGRLPPRP